MGHTEKSAYGLCLCCLAHLVIQIDVEDEYTIVTSIKAALTAQVAEERPASFGLRRLVTCISWPSGCKLWLQPHDILDMGILFVSIIFVVVHCRRWIPTAVGLMQGNAVCRAPTALHIAAKQSRQQKSHTHRYDRFKTVCVYSE